MGNALQVIELLNSLMSVISVTVEHAQKVGAILKQAQDEGRDVTDAELSKIITEDDVARTALESAIKARTRP